MQANKELAKVILKPLTDLGKTPKQMAASLKKLRRKGAKSDRRYCVLAQHLKKEWKEDNVEVYNKIEVNGVRIASKFIPWNIQAFIIKFDEGKYPDLEEQ